MNTLCGLGICLETGLCLVLCYTTTVLTFSAPEYIIKIIHSTI